MSTEFKYTRELRFWCQKVLPLVYDDSLSYYELLCKVVAKLNTLIENNNNLPEIIREEIKQYITPESIKEILSEIFDDLRANIAVADEHESPTATDDRETGDWVWLNDNLYVVVRPMDIGDAYIVTGSNPNVAKTTVEDRVKYYVEYLTNELNDAIATEAQAREEAIDAEAQAREDADTLLDGKIDDEITNRENADIVLDGKIDDEITNRENADIVLDGKIDDEITNRENADSALDSKIGDLNDLTTIDKTSVVNAINSLDNATNKLIVYVPSDILGLDNTGVDDCSLILSGITDNVGLKAGTYKIATSCVISCNILFPQGAKFVVSSGVSVTFDGYVDAGLYQIIEGDGDILFTKNSATYPEWFGAKHDLVTDDAGAIQKAIDSLKCGAVILQSGRYNYYQDSTPTVGYRIESSLQISDEQSDISIKCLNGKAVICSTANIGIRIDGSTDNGSSDFVSNATLENIILFYVGNILTASSYNTTIGIRVHGGIRNRIYKCEVYKYLTSIYSDTIVGHYVEDCTLHSINTAYSTCIYLNDNVINNAIYPNASFHVNNSILFGGSNSVGITGIGSTISDLFVRNNEFGGFYECISLTLSGDVQPMVAALDIHITDNIMDNVRRGIDIYGNGIYNASCNIQGNWIANNNDYCILLRGMYNASICNNILNGALSSNSYQITLNSCRHVAVVGNTLSDFRCGIQLLSCSYVSVGNNVLQSGKALNTTAIQLDSNSTRNNVSNNTIFRASSGTMAYALDVAGTDNVINWNNKQPAIPNSIAAGNIVDGS